MIDSLTCDRIVGVPQKTLYFQHMPQVRPLKHAPIKEALIDIQVSLPEHFDVESLSRTSEEFNKKYPKGEDRWEFTGQINFDVNSPTTNISESKIKQGRQFKSEDGNKIVQFRRNGFTYNWLEPYDSWDSLIKNARECWSEYQKITGNQSLQRIAIRFINHLKFARNEFVPEKFIAAPIHIPLGLPLTISGYLNRVNIEDQKLDYKVNLIQAIRSEDDSVVFILDTDVYTIVSGSILSPSGIWEKLNQFRDVKNKAFFETLTEECLKKYE